MMFKQKIKSFLSIFGIRISSIPKKMSESDEPVFGQVGNFKMLLTKTHALPGHLKHFPLYSSNLPRLVLTVKEKYSNLILIDVGANIGDTVALTRSISSCPIVCIEGDDLYFNILKKNIAQFNEVVAYQYFLGETDKTISGKTERDVGTLKITPSTDPDPEKDLQILTLDTFLSLHSNYKTAKLLKIDTDGFDLMILRGGKNIFRRPNLFYSLNTIRAYWLR